MFRKRHIQKMRFPSVGILKHYPRCTIVGALGLMITAANVGYALDHSATTSPFSVSNLWHTAGYVFGQDNPAPPPQPTFAQNNKETGLPEVLTAADRALYQRIHKLQKKGEWGQSRALTEQIQDPLLLGHVEAERYLHESYTSSFDELAGWLAKYRDYPEAPQIYRLAMKKKPANVAALSVPEPTIPKTVLTGYTGAAPDTSKKSLVISESNWEGRQETRAVWDKVQSHLRSDNLTQAHSLLLEHAGSLSERERGVLGYTLAYAYFTHGRDSDAYRMAKALMRNSSEEVPQLHWVAGLSAWRLNDKPEAARQFSRLADAESHISPWEKAAGAYWAYRAHSHLKDTARATHYLHLAAAQKRSFYGILARKAIGTDMDLALEQKKLTRSDILDLYDIPAIRRAVGLAEIHDLEKSENEFRRVFVSLPRETRAQMISLVNALNMPALQIRMGHSLAREGKLLDYAFYPTPSWEPTTGYGIDPALLFAFVRQESGFQSGAKSQSGAIGMMQLMPQTAQSMRRMLAADENNKSSHKQLTEPVTNITLGQTYLSYLLDQNMVRGNLIFLAAAYNAGPGKVASWKESMRYQNDPLLFIESIPYRETRSYVTQVLAAYWVYSEMLGGNADSLTAMSKGEWPIYSANAKQMASLLMSKNSFEN